MLSTRKRAIRKRKATKATGPVEHSKPVPKRRRPWWGAVRRRELPHQLEVQVWWLRPALALVVHAELLAELQRQQAEHCSKAA